MCEAETTSLLTLQFLDGSVQTIIVDTIPVLNINEDEGSGFTFWQMNVSIEADGLKVGDKLGAVYLMNTNDPTPAHANVVVSLGYYSTRFRMVCAEIVSLSPFTVKCLKPEYPEEGVFIKFTRPLRRVNR